MLSIRRLLLTFRRLSLRPLAYSSSQHSLFDEYFSIKKTHSSITPLSRPPPSPPVSLP